MRHRNVDVLFLCAGYQRLRDRMLSIALDGSSHAKHLVVGEAIGRGDFNDAMRTERELSCPVKYNRVQKTSLFEAASITHEQAIVCANRRRDRGHQRDGQTQRMRAGDHEHGHHALHCEAPWLTEEWPYYGRDGDRKSTRLNSSHVAISYAAFCLKKEKKISCS